MASKHIAIETWLKAVGLLEYKDMFSKFHGVEALLSMTEADIRELGVKNGSHRVRLISSLQLLKQKYYQAQGKRGQPPSTQPAISVQRSHSTHLGPTSVSSIYQDCNALTASPEKMQHDLQTELHGDPGDLRSHEWYHGNIPRQRAEKLTVKKGDYLVRDCVSQPGNFVLTCSWMGVSLHFIINAKVIQPTTGGPPKVFYQFEDESCRSVQDLVQYYCDMKKPITESSGAVINNPIGRSMPLSYYDTKYGATANLSAKLGLQGTYTPSQSPRPSPFASPNDSPRGSPKLKRTSPMRTESQPHLSSASSRRSPASHSPSPISDRFGSLPSISGSPKAPRKARDECSLLPMVIFHQRSGSEPLLLTPTNENRSFSYEDELDGKLEGKMTPASSDSSLNKAPPPKPSRVPSVKYLKRPKVQIRNKALYDDDDRDYSDYDTVKSKPSWLESYVQDTRKAMKELQVSQAQPMEHSTTNGSSEENIYDNNFSEKPPEPIYEPLKDHSGKTVDVDTEEETGEGILRKRHPANRNQNLDSSKENVIDSDDSEKFYDTSFLRSRVISMPPQEIDSICNLTLYMTSLLPYENRPLEASGMVKVKTLLLECNAKLLAKHLTKVDLEVAKVIGDNDLGMGVQSGLELVTLPQGKQLRQDLMERCRCMHMFVSTMILTCTSIMERARMLSQWINIAMELRTTTGNLYGFVAVMDGIVAEEIQRLRDTWMILRQNHTSSAFLFDTKLRTFYKSLNDGSASLPLQNVSIPSIAPLAHLMERDLESVLDLLPWEDSNESGIDTLLSHLDTARVITSHFNIYRAMGQAVLSELREDRELIDMFSTPFHLRLLWGSRGAGVNRPDRYNKYQQLLMVLSERAERPGDEGTEL